DLASQVAAEPIAQQRLQAYLELSAEPPTSDQPPPVTVAVCTRDRPNDLERCLRGLLALPARGQELLVVDNAPSGTWTEAVVRRHPGVRYLREEQPGLNHARNHALRAARHEIVAFLDDDATPDPIWLRGLLEPFADPRVLCVTGLTMPLELETPAQEWFERYSPFGRGFERRIFDGSRQTPLAVGPIGAGANMALRREVLDLVGPFDVALDAGTATHSGGDHDMFARILIGGYQIVYQPAALSWHRHR